MAKSVTLKKAATKKRSVKVKLTSKSSQKTTANALASPAITKLPPLGETGLVVVAEAIRALDPNHEFVRLDVSARTVQYSDSFVLHEALSAYEGEEEVARAYIVTWLCTLGGYLPANIELEKRYSIGRPKEGAELDVLIRHPTGEP